MDAFKNREPLIRSPGDADRNSHAGIVAVVHVVAVVSMGDVDFVVVVPIVRPFLRPRVEKRNPITLVLESGVSVINRKGETIEPRPMPLAEIAAIAVLGNPIAV